MMMEETHCYCSVVAYIERKNRTEQIFKDLLEDIKLPFNLFEYDRLATEDVNTLENSVLERNPQFLAICLFLKEDSKLECTLKRHLETSPWQLDHVIESSLTKRPRKIARQVFYSCSNDIPLVSVSSVHYGNEHVRFHINAKNFYAMKKFYEDITERKAKDCGPDFCFLTVYSEDGLDVQIGLKKNPAVSPVRTTSFRLKFRIQSVSPLFKYLASSRDSTNEANYILPDPDGNDVIIERSYVKSDNSSHCESVYQVDENNNFELRILEKDLNSSLRKHLWSKSEYSEHGLFPHEAMSIGDDVPTKREENENERKDIVNHGYKNHMTFV
jgi:hypothetical protein